MYRSKTKFVHAFQFWAETSIPTWLKELATRPPGVVLYVMPDGKARRVEVAGHGSMRDGEWLVHDPVSGGYRVWQHAEFEKSFVEYGGCGHVKLIREDLELREDRSRMSWRVCDTSMKRRAALGEFYGENMDEAKLLAELFMSLPTIQCELDVVMATLKKLTDRMSDDEFKVLTDGIDEELKAAYRVRGVTLRV